MSNRILSDRNLLTRQEVAEVLGCSVSTVDRYANRRLIARRRIGGLTRFSRADVEALITGKRPRPAKTPRVIDLTSNDH